MAEGPDCRKDESIFEWDETSQLYFHASSGFYHDPNAGWYYSSRDALYYKFENGNYVLLDSQKCDDCTVNEGGEVLDTTIQDQQFTNSYCQNDECCSSFRVSESDGIGAAADQCNPEPVTCGSSHDTENPPPPPSEWLEDTLIDLYLSGYSTTAISATDEVRMPSETDDGDNFEPSAIAAGNGDMHELKGECVPEDHQSISDSIGTVASEDDSWDEENWRAQYGQVIKSEDPIPDLPVVNLWDWAIMSGVKKDGKGQVTRLVGRLVRQSTKLHPSMPSGGGLLKSAPICEVHLDLVRVTSGQIYRLKSPSSRYLASLSFYDSSNPTKDWSFPKLLVDQNMLPLSKCTNRESKGTDKAAIGEDLFALQDPRSSSSKLRNLTYRDRAAERRTLHGGFGVGPGQKNLAVGEAIRSPPDSVSTEDAAVEALNMSFGAGSYARRILESMGWKEGEALGNTTKGLLEPLEAVANIGNAGLGWPQPRSTTKHK